MSKSSHYVSYLVYMNQIEFLCGLKLPAQNVFLPLNFCWSRFLDGMIIFDMMFGIRICCRHNVIYVKLYTPTHQGASKVENLCLLDLISGTHYDFNRKQWGNIGVARCNSCVYKQLE